MTRTTKPKLGKAGDIKESTWGGYVNVPLNDDEKTHFKAWASENETEIAETIADIQLAGFKFSSTWDAENDCFIATLTGTGIRKVQATWVCAMSARGNTWFTALALVVYKHVVVCENDWSAYWTEAKRKFGSEV